MNSKRIFQIVVAGVLCAVGMAVPMFMPKIVLGPMSFTLASHVPVFLAMFISPMVALAVCIGSALGFFVTTPLIIALRAASHIVFALLGAWLLKKKPALADSASGLLLLNLVLAFVHAVCEVVVVTPFFFAGNMFSVQQLADGYVMSVLGLVGGGTMLHSLIDFSIAAVLWRAVCAGVPQLKLLKD